MSLIANRRFYDEKLNVDGCGFHNVVFDGCILVATRKTCFTGTTQAIDCKMLGDGWADGVLMLNAAHLSRRRPEPEHEPEVTMTTAERKATGSHRVTEFVVWLVERGFK